MSERLLIGFSFEHFSDFHLFPSFHLTRRYRRPLIYFVMPKFINIILLTFLSCICLSAETQTPKPIDESVPLGDKASPRSVTIKDKNGNPIPNAIITVEYSSLKNPPQFKTDEKGNATIMVKAGYWGIGVKTAETQVMIQGKIEWPCVVQV